MQDCILLQCPTLSQIRSKTTPSLFSVTQITRQPLRNLSTAIRRVNFLGIPAEPSISNSALEKLRLRTVQDIFVLPKETIPALKTFFRSRYPMTKPQTSLAMSNGFGFLSILKMRGAFNVINSVYAGTCETVGQSRLSPEIAFDQARLRYLPTITRSTGLQCALNRVRSV